MVNLFSIFDNFYKKINNPQIIEELYSLELEGNISVSSFEKINLVEITEVFKNSLYLNVIPSVADPFNISHPFSNENFIQLIRDLKDIGESKVKIIIKFNKKEFIEEFLQKNNPNVNIIIFIFCEHFYKWFNKYNPSQLEEYLKYNQKNIILLYNQNIILENNYLSIIGFNSLAQIIEYLKKDKNLDKTNYILAEIIKSRNENCSWVEGTQFLTPDFFNYKNLDKVDDYFLLEAISIKSIAIIIPFLSSVTQVENKDIVSTIFGYKTIKIVLNKENIKKNNIKNLLILFDLYKWIYESKTTDKLGIFRNISTLYLKEDSSQNLTCLLENIQDISRSVRRSFDIYLKENIELYFNQRKKIEDFIQAKVGEFSQQISAILGLMSKNLLTMLGVVLGGILTYFSTQNKVVINVALWSYILFLLINTLYYGVYSRKSVNHILQEYNRYILYVKKTFIEKEVDDLVGNIINKKEDMFKCFFNATIFLSMILLLITLFIIFNLDTIIKNF